MDRVYTSGASGSAPAVPASPSAGYPTAGNPGLGTPATKPGPYWFHMVSQELWKLITDAGLTPDHTNLGQVSQAVQAMIASLTSTKQIQPVAASVSANALTVSISPTVRDFRSTTLGSGVVNTRTLAAPATMVVPSGATLGTISGQLSKIALLLLDNAGTLEAAVVNLAGGVNLDESGLISTTAVSAGATSASVVYSTTARSNVPYRVQGIIESTQTTAGTWATAPSLIQGAGGQALGSLQSLGFGQTVQNLTGSRAFGTTYYNTTGKPIHVNVNSGGVSSATSALLVSINGGTPYTFGQSQLPSGSAQSCGDFIVGPGESYAVTNSGGNTLNAWHERR